MTEYFESADAAIAWVNGARYQGEKHGLDNMRALLRALGDPQTRLRCVHVAGTNGKGSTCAMLERMLRACGLKTGLYTSPYLMRFQERVRVNGAPISDESLVRLAGCVREAAEELVARGVKPTTFELGTALAFMQFEEARVDVAVIEVGLGGRLDPTNVILPELCLIAAIGLDHVKLLGGTLPEIAFEKAGIIKPSVPVIVGRQSDAQVYDVFRRVAAERQAPLALLDGESESLSEDERGSTILWRGREARVPLAGRHQDDNARLALAGAWALRDMGWPLSEETMLDGLSKTRWPGRLEWIGDNLLLDGAHNAHGARSLAAYVREQLAGKRVVLAVGMMRDKDVSACAEVYAGFAEHAIATRVDYPRAMDALALAETLRDVGLSAEAEPDWQVAVSRARALAGEDGVAVVCGSLYLVGATRLMLLDDGGAI